MRVGTPAGRHVLLVTGRVWECNTDGVNADLAEVLRGTSLLSSMSEADLDALLPRIRHRRLISGELLFAEGDRSEDLAIILSGRLASTRAGDLIGESVHGEAVGELGVLTGEPRVTTVTAVRDSEVLLIPRAAVHDVIRANPQLAVELASMVAQRLRHPAGRHRSLEIVVVVADSESADAIGLANELAIALDAHVVRQLDSERDLHHLVEQVDRDDRRVVLLAEGDDWWRESCRRQADVVLRVVSAADRPRRLDFGTRDELVVLHDDGTTPRGTGIWLHDAPVAHHHLRRRHAGDLDRLKRRVLGRTIGVVLSGGGARGMAHLGAYRALIEAGVPIDHVGGTSMGAITGVQMAMQHDPMALIAANRALFLRANVGRKFTMPVVSMMSVRTVLPVFKELFGDADLADSWIPNYVSVADFSDCSLTFRDRGPAGTWVRASASPPGIWPPVVDEHGHLYVDGGVLDNLPVAAMRQRAAGKVIAVNVSRVTPFGVEPGTDEVTSWFRLVDPRRRHRASGYPTLPKLLLRLGLLTSLPRQAAESKLADLYVEPPVSQFGMGQFARFDTIVEAGYDAMRRALDERGDEVFSWC